MRNTTCSLEWLPHCEGRRAGRRALPQWDLQAGDQGWRGGLKPLKSAIKAPAHLLLHVFIVRQLGGEPVHAVRSGSTSSRHPKARRCSRRQSTAPEAVRGPVLPAWARCSMLPLDISCESSQEFCEHLCEHKVTWDKLD